MLLLKFLNHAKQASFFMLSIFILLFAQISLAETTPESTPRPPTRAEISNFLLSSERRMIIKNHSLELSPFIGPILGQALTTSVFYGMRTNYHVTERFALAIDGGFSESGVDPFTLGTVTTSGDKNSYFINGNLLYHFPGALGTFRNKLLQSDLFVTAGGGVFVLNGVVEPSVNLGGGTKMYLSRYFVLRIDIRNYLIRFGPPQNQKISANALIMFGLSFFLPTEVPAGN